MKNLFLFLIALFVFGCQPKSSEKDGKFEVFRGTNIAHWLSQSKVRGAEREQFFTKADVDSIAAMGFDHVRLPIDEEQMWDKNGDRYDDAFFS